MRCMYQLEVEELECSQEEIVEHFHQDHGSYCAMRLCGPSSPFCSPDFQMFPTMMLPAFYYCYEKS